MTITCQCGHTAPYEAFQPGGMTGKEYQCPACLCHWRVVPVGEPVRLPSGLILPPDQRTEILSPSQPLLPGIPAAVVAVPAAVLPSRQSEAAALADRLTKAVPEGTPGDVLLRALSYVVAGAFTMQDDPQAALESFQHKLEGHMLRHEQCQASMDYLASLNAGGGQ